jgi:hypothetical protein
MVLVNAFTMVTLNLAFLVISVILYKQKGYMLMAAIQDETDEWSLGAITDIKTVNATYGKIP